ncbi:hypothetical protein EV421DRAFT_1742103 [Armillaria borealis]|uniref:F-box domain-containing protein n=1 Tax=Armillaria borealis TaxID=47425 RepID=A0AA39IZJ0_9AGAR|nr:hypothetical protein EV421DRAFT_1742103 [Armillaria borealis]
MPPCNLSKRKQVDSSPVPASSPETQSVPRKRNKTAPVTPIAKSGKSTAALVASSKSSHALLPAVSITSHQSRGAASSRRVSYGNLSEEEVESVAQQSDVADSELSAHSLHRCGHVLFVDDEASEGTGESAAGSDADEEVSVKDIAESDSSSVGDVDSESESAGDAIEPAIMQGRSSRIKTKTAKGAYVDSMLSSGKEGDITNDDDPKKDPTVPSLTSCSKKPDTQVYLEDLESLRPSTRTKNKSPVKPSTAAGSRKSKAVKNNRCLQVEVSVDPVSKSISKSIALSPSKTRKKSAASMENDDVVDIPPPSTRSNRRSSKKETIVIDSSESDGEDDDCSADTATTKPSKTAKSRPDKVSGSGRSKASNKPPVKSALKSGSGSDLSLERTGKAKGKGKDAPPSPSTSVLPSSQIAHQLMALLRSTSSVDLSEPANVTLRVMQPQLIEEHLVTLGVYLELPPLGYYRIVVPVGYPPNNFDPPAFHSFDVVSKLFHVESLMSLLEYFKWTLYGSYVNLGCLAYSILSLEGRTACMGDSPAMCMTVGLVTECLLFQPATLMGFGGNVGKRVHCLRIMPFHQWFHRESTMWGLLVGLDFTETTCLSDQDSSSQASPAKGKDSHWRTLVKNVSAVTVSPGGDYPSSLGFGDEGFNNEPRLTPNILFVIVLGSAPKKDALATQVLLKYGTPLLFVFRSTLSMAFYNLTDIPFDDALEDRIVDDIDTYNDGLDDMELLGCIEHGDHLYYRYMEQLAHVTHPSNSALYRSLFEGYHYLISDAPTYVNPLLQYYIPDADCRPSLHNPNYLPAEMWTKVFLLLPRDELPVLQLVCIFWNNVSSRLVFTSVRLQLPFAWQLSSRSEVYRCLANRSEVGLVLFATRNDLSDVIQTITFLNWAFTPYCFFLHSFTNVHTVRFLADAGTPTTTPHIPYPYLLPLTMTHLVISRCSLEGHSVEGMLSPDTSLRSLELRGLEHGTMYLPPVPGPMEVATCLTIHTSPHFWHYSVQSTFMWASLPRSLELSELHMIVSYKGDDYVLHTNMHRTHLEHMVQGLVDSILQLQWVLFRVLLLWLFLKTGEWGVIYQLITVCHVVNALLEQLDMALHKTEAKGDYYTMPMWLELPPKLGEREKDSSWHRTTSSTRL